MSQILLVNGFNWVEETFQFNENFIKIYDEDSDIEYIIKVDIQLPEKLYELHNDLLYLPEKMKIEKLKSLWQIYTVKKNVIHIRYLRQALNHKISF